MARFLLRSSILRAVLTAVCMPLLACLLASVAFAQHPGAHGGPHPGVAAPHGGARPVAPPPVSRSRFSPGPPPMGASAYRFRYYPRPIYPWRPIYPVYWYPFYLGGPLFYGCGAGWGFNPYSWPTCNVFWSWGLGYNLPFYQYGPGYYSPPQLYEYPRYLGDERRDLPELFLKDGTILTVTDYWVVDDQLHYKTLAGGATPVEQVIAFDELDLQRTIDVAEERGFRFVLRNQPLEHYFQDSPDVWPPAERPPED